MSSGNKWYVGSDFTGKMYSESAAKHYLARLQSIITEKAKESHFKSSENNFTYIQTNKGMDLAASMFSIIPDETNTGHHAITLKVINNSHGIFFPRRTIGKTNCYVKTNFDICPSGEYTELRIICRNEYWNSSHGSVEIEFYLSFSEVLYLFKILIEIKTNKWVPIKISSYLVPDSRIFTIDENLHFFNDTTNELSLYRVQHATDDDMACCLSAFSTSADTDDARISLVLMPWYRDAEKI